MWVCNSHGAKAPNAIRKAQERGLDQEVHKLLEIEGQFEPILDPYALLASIAGEVDYVKDILREQVEGLRDLEDIGTDKKMTQIAVVFQAYERFLAHAGKLATDMSKLDLTARIASVRAAVDEATAAIVRDALTRALDNPRIQPDTRNEVLREFGVALRSPKLAQPALTA